LKLGQIIKVVKGRKPTSVSDVRLDGYRQLLQIEDLRPNSSPRFCPSDDRETVVEPSDVLIAWDGANAGTASYGLSGVAGSTIARLRTGGENVFTPYLGRFVQSKQKYLRDHSRGATVPHLRSDILSKLEIPLPPLEEQRRIAAILDKADELRTKRREAIAKLDTLAQSIFIDMFGDPVTNPMGWEQCELGNHVTKVGSGATPRGGSAAYKTEGIPLIRSMNVRDGAFETKGMAFLDDDQAEKLSNVVVEANDVLLNITGASVARVCLAPDFSPQARVNQHVAIIRPTDKFFPEFIEKMMLCASYKQQLEKIAESGATRQAITKDQILNLRVILPPTDLQQRFADSLRSMQSNAFAQAIYATQQDLLFSSLQQRAFKENCRTL